MPMRLDEGWNQIQFNLSDFTRRAYGSNYIETLRVQIHANCRIRRIYFSDRLYGEDDLPAEFKLFLPIQVRSCRCTQPRPHELDLTRVQWVPRCRIHVALLRRNRRRRRRQLPQRLLLLGAVAPAMRVQPAVRVGRRRRVAMLRWRGLVGRPELLVGTAAAGMAALALPKAATVAPIQSAVATVL